MNAWLQECEACMYVASDISEAITNATVMLASDEYRQISGLDIPSLGTRFLRYSLLCDDPVKRGVNRLRAAWTCDDAGDTESARRIRHEAAEILLELRPFDKAEDDVTTGVILVDVLRRCSRFKDAETLLQQLQGTREVQDNDTIAKVLLLQDQLCEKRDISCYTVADAVESAG